MHVPPRRRSRAQAAARSWREEMCRRAPTSMHWSKPSKPASARWTTFSTTPGRATFASIDQMTEASWNEIIQFNLSSVFLVTQAVLPGMRARKWGRIINLTSVAAQAGSMMAVHYSAAKAGVIAATKSYARLLAKEGVTVNAISPALIGTEMVTSNPHVKPDMIPVGRFGQVEECADVAVMLAGNAYITGQTIGVNGGMYLGS